MRTRIVLTVAIIFAVALIGSARPAAPAVENHAVAGIAAVPTPAGEAAADARQDSQEAKQEAAKEKKTEQAEKKAEKKQTVAKTIVITTAKADKPHLEITIDEGGQAKTLFLSHPVILEAGGAGEPVTLKIEGKDIVLKKGQKLTIVSEGGSVKLIGEGEVHEHGIGVPVLIKIGEKGSETLVIKEVPEAKVVKEVMVRPVVIAEVPAPPAAPTPPAQPAAPAKIRTYEVVSDGKTHTIVLSPRQPYSPHPPAIAYSVVPAHGIDVNRKEIRDELKKIEDELKSLEQRRPDVQKDLQGIEKSLQALTEKLEKAAAKLDAYTLKVGVPVQHVTVGVPAEHISIVTEAGVEGTKHGVIYSEAGEKAHVVTVSRGEKEAVTVIYQTGEVIKDEAAVARALDKVKKALPQGYGLESKTAKESGALTLKIKTPEGQEVDEGLLKKIVAILVEELKKTTAEKD